ncbi:hypothetical protein V496_03282 [Pseudogymnoascus sp. VKM F-4515 (FW-2607)]|nr:hypothetical protein V496_03282 [Pseudogymnoascus sp. VKM F-4515 (FW-2607)]KFZ00497.1 hypothetical protein V498_00022 [Pseudogymnoascus sp. VKM F-4517 (FW-2822)]
MATTTTLLSLPLELLYQITDDLSYGTHLALSFTCRELYARLDPNQKAKSPKLERVYDIEGLLEIELWPEFASSHPEPLEKRKPDKDDFFACCLCLRIRSGWNFATTNMTGDYGNVVVPASSFQIPSEYSDQLIVFSGYTHTLPTLVLGYWR